MTEPALLRRDDGLPYQTIEGQVLVVVPKAREVHLLNETASRVWELLGPGATVGGLVDALCGEYDVAPGEARAAVEAVLDEMRRKGLMARGRGEP